MLERRWPNTGIGFHSERAALCTMRNAELLLMLAAVGVILMVLVLSLRNAVVGGTPPCMATITVESGDTLWSLAREYGDPDQYILERVNALAKANGMPKNQVLREGQKLVIPVANRNADLYYGGKYASREIAD